MVGFLRSRADYAQIADFLWLCCRERVYRWTEISTALRMLGHMGGDDVRESNRVSGLLKARMAPGYVQKVGDGQYRLIHA
jgi:hypothetical protein